MRIIKLFLIPIFCLMGLNSFAQDDPSNESGKEKIEAMKISFITKKLSLTTDEAKVFWPIYNQYELDLENLRKNHKKERQLDDSSPSDKEIERLIDSEITFLQNELDIKKKYIAQFKKVLPVKKVFMLNKAEEDFKRELLKQLKEKNQNR